MSRQKERRGQNAVEVPVARPITDVTSRTLRSTRKRNLGTPVSYMRKEALKRGPLEQLKNHHLKDR
jgi:hypothetical protein